MRAASRLFVGVALLLCATAARAQQADEYINALLQTHRIPGLSLVVLKDGKIIKAAGYGLADVKARTPATPETVYKIGSVSKQIIAAGIMLLVQSNQLKLDDPINKFLEKPPEAWNAITIRHLLTHTSGLIREAPGFDPNKIQSDAAVIRTAYPLPLRFAPGDKWEYSNVGYFILAEVIQRVTGQPWSEYLSENIFRRVGMNATRTTTTRESVPKLARGYSDNDKWRDAANWVALRPSGAFLSTVLDLAKWDAALSSSEILSDSIRKLMWTPVTLNNGLSHPYGFGWHTSALAGHKAMHHGGGLPGFVSYFARFPDDNLTVIILTNIDDVDMLSVVPGIASLYLPKPTEQRRDHQLPDIDRLPVLLNGALVRRGSRIRTSPVTRYLSVPLSSMPRSGALKSE
jgi:D-alanyl-D-alanine carboxypeptidase